MLTSLAPTTVRLLADTRLFALVGPPNQAGAAAAPAPDAALLFACARFLRFGAVHHPHLLLGGAQPPGEAPCCSLDSQVCARPRAYSGLRGRAYVWSRLVSLQVHTCVVHPGLPDSKAPSFGPGCKLTTDLSACS